MDWINNLFTIHSSIQTVVILSIIIACGLGIGKLKVMGISLGIAFVFFVGILPGTLVSALIPRYLTMLKPSVWPCLSIVSVCM